MGRPSRSFSTTSTILVPVDGSDRADAALEYAVDIAAASGATILLLNVLDTTDAPFRFGVADVHKLEQAKSQLIEDILEAYSEHSVSISGTVRRGSPAEEILNHATQADCDMIVIGQTGASNIEQTLLGSTVDRVLRSTEIPVVIVP